MKEKFLSLRKTEPHLENNILFFKDAFFVVVKKDYNVKNNYNLGRKVLSGTSNSNVVFDKNSFFKKNFSRRKVSSIIAGLEFKFFILSEHKKSVYEKIGFFSSSVLSKFNVFYTHCHSSMAVKAILSSNPKVVYNTETRPLFQGRKTALELSAGVVVKHFVDSYFASIIPKVDVVVLGCDEITEDGRIVNKIGTKSIVIIAEKFGIPVFFVADSFKLKLYSSSIGDSDLVEFRSKSEVWNINKKNLFVYNPAFEVVDLKEFGNVKIIFEEGVVSIGEFVSIAKNKLLGL